MEIPYLKWKNDNAVEYYQELIDHAKEQMLPVPPIDHDQRPKEMSVIDILNELRKRDLKDIYDIVYSIAMERHNEIDIYDKCQDMITKYNYGNYDKIKDILLYKKLK